MSSTCRYLILVWLGNCGPPMTIFIFHSKKAPRKKEAGEVIAIKIVRHSVVHKKKVPSQFKTYLVCIIIRINAFVKKKPSL